MWIERMREGGFRISERMDCRFTQTLLSLSAKEPKGDHMIMWLHLGFFSGREYLMFVLNGY